MIRLPILCAIACATTPALAPRAAHAEDLAAVDYEVVATFGVEESDPLIAQPTTVSASDDGATFYVYGASTCQVVVLDAALREVRRFGRCGEGPGDLGDVLAIRRVADEVHLIMNHRIARHALDGTYLGEISLAERPLGAPVVLLDERILACAYPSFDRLMIVDPASDAAPRTVLDLGGEDVLKSMGRHGDDVYFYGSRSGAIFRVDGETGDTERFSIGLGSAEVEARASGSGSASYWQSPITAAWVDATGVYVATQEENAAHWKRLAARRDAEESDIQYVVRRYDHALESPRLVRFRPSGWPLLDVTAISSGHLVILDRWGSRGVVLRRPVESGAGSADMRR